MNRFVLETDTRPPLGYPPVKTYDRILDKVIKQEDRANIVEDALGWALLNFKLNQSATELLGGRRSMNDLVSALERIIPRDPISFAFRSQVERMAERVKDIDPAGSVALHAISVCISARLHDHSSQWCAYALDTIIDFAGNYRRLRESGADPTSIFVATARKRIELMIELYDTDFPLVDYHERRAS